MNLVINILLELVRKHPWLVVANLVMMVFMPIHEVLLPYLFGRVMTGIGKPRWWVPLVGVGAVLTVVQLGHLLRDWLDVHFLPATEGFIKVRVMNALLDKHRTSFGSISTGDIVYRLTRAPQIVTQYFTWATDYVLPYLITVVSATVYFMRFDITLGSAFVAYIALLIYMLQRAPRVCEGTARRNDSIFASMHAKLEDIVQNMGSVYNSRGGREAEESALTAAISEYGHEYARSTLCTAWFKVVLVPATVALVVVVVMRSHALIVQGRATTERFVSMFMVLTSLLGSVLWLIDIIKSVTLDVGSLTNLDAMIAPQSGATRQLLPGRPPWADGIGLRNVTYSQTAAAAAAASAAPPPTLSDVSMHFQPGRITALMGPVGVGKSTVFKLLLGFATPQLGDAYMDGKWYSELGVDAVRDRIGYVPQVPVLFDDTVIYNIMYGSSPDRDADARRLAASVGFDGAFLDHPVGKGGSALSGGQRQLVWCLRILLRDPDVMLLDEPTANMDEASGAALMRLLRSHASDRGATVVVITHDPVLADAADGHVELLNHNTVVQSTF